MANLSQSKKGLFFEAKQLKQIPVFLIPKEEKEITSRKTPSSLQRGKKYPNHSTKIKFQQNLSNYALFYCKKRIKIILAFSKKTTFFKVALKIKS